MEEFNRLELANMPSDSIENGRSMISIRQARANNLKNIDVDIPLAKFVVVTGPSGSGKSSLAVDTLFAEGQRQYIESLSTYARQFFSQVPRPAVDEVIGLPPTLCINQRHGNINPRSTVGTQTEIHDHLRLLFARVGTVKCFECGANIEQQSLEQIRQTVLSFASKTKLMVLAPLVRDMPGTHQEIFDQIRKERLIRVRLNGEVLDIEQVGVLDPGQRHSIEVVTDRIVIREDIGPRLMEALTNAERLGNGLINIVFLPPGPVDSSSQAGPNWQEQLFNTRHQCPLCTTSYAEIEPRTFSFNSPYGMCPRCEGMGSKQQFDWRRLIPDTNRSLSDGAIEAWQSLKPKEREKWFDQLRPIVDDAKISFQAPVSSWSDQQCKLFLAGKDKQKIGLLDLFEKEFATCQDESRWVELETLRGLVQCPECHGSRLGRAGNSVYLAGETISQWCLRSIGELGDRLSGLELSVEKQKIAEVIVDEIRTRLTFLKKVGLSYLTLERATSSLSGGEFQRIRLASAIGTGLAGVCYVLDEPSIGLHPADNQKLIDTIRQLQIQGNTAVVVEHDEEMMRQSDWLIDMGPAAGRAGGNVVAYGKPEDVAKNPDSPTGRWLSDKPRLNRRSHRVGGDKRIVLVGAGGFNLKNLTVEFPLNRFVCVTGVSGSGKSTLVRKTLYPAVAERLGIHHPQAEPFESISGVESIDKMIWVDQQPIGKTSRGCLATYSGIFPEVRNLFAATKIAKQLGFSASRFSFNSDRGRCATCQGLGQIKIEMNFVPDTYVLCSECRGARYNQQTLAVKFKQQSIADILDLEVSQAIQFFDSIEKIRRVLDCFEQVGLGYVKLGQPSNSFSGGEAQRLKLATELARGSAKNGLYLLDEPTTGLHFADVARLMHVLLALVEQGNSVIVIEHHLDVIDNSDWVIDLGPGGGDAGGELVACGFPEQIRDREHSLTGQALKQMIP